MRSSLACILILMLTWSITAQQTTIDLQKAKEWHMQNMDSCVHYADRVLATSGNASDSVMAQATFLKGWNLFLKNEYQSAIDALRQISRYSSERNLMYVRSVGRIGISFKELNQYDSAIHYLQRYDELVDEYIGADAIEAKLELGELYRAMKRLDVSNTYKLEALKRAGTSGKKMDRIMTLYYYLDDNINHIAKPEYGKYLDEFLELTEKTKIDGSTDRTHSGMLLINLQGDEKLRSLEADIQNLESLEPDRGYLFLSHHLTGMYLKSNVLDKAAQQAKKGMDAALKVRDQGYRMDFLKQLAAIEEHRSNETVALEYIKLYYSLKDSLLSASTQQNVDSLRIQYESAKKEEQIIAQQLHIQKQRNLRNMLVAGIIMLAGLAFFIFIYLRNRARLLEKMALQESNLQRQKIEKLENEKKLLAMSSLIEGQEAERIRISRDLHDGLGGLLSTVKTHFSAIQNEIERLESINIYDKVNELIDTASAEVRRISHNMAPHALQISGLKDALQDICHQNQSDQLKIKYEWIGSTSRMPEHLEVMLYRITQELINNVVKHAHAKNLLVQINCNENELYLIVEDDGKGFDFAEAIKCGGMGLTSIQSRVKYLGGTMDVDSDTGVGTTFTIHTTI